MITEIVCDMCHKLIPISKENYIKLNAQIIHSDLTLEYYSPSLDFCEECAKVLLKPLGMDIGGKIDGTKQ